MEDCKIMSKIVRELKKVKERISIIFSYYVLYPIWTRKFNFQIMSDAETIDSIIEKRLSISRFGDGEYGMIRGGAIGFQMADKELSKRLGEILKVQEEGHLNCIPLFFKTTKELTKHAALYCRSFAVFHAREYKEYTPEMRLYGSQGFTRFYADYKNKGV